LVQAGYTGEESIMVAILRSIGGVVVGVLAGCLVVFLMELPGFYLHPLPPGVDPSNSEALRAHVARAPLVAMALVGSRGRSAHWQRRWWQG
jgi:hypothetical protein